MDISWSRVLHRGAGRILIEFPYNPTFSDTLRAEVGARWSKTLRAWHIEDTKENIEKVLIIVEKVMTQNNSDCENA